MALDARTASCTGPKNVILSIESSCDDSSIAITEIETKRLIFHQKISQELEHAMYGGVVPELASRLHAEALPKLLEACRPWFGQLKAIAVTTAPGLAVTLVEGVTMAKALSLTLGVPLIGVNHLKGHIYSLFIEQEAQLPVTVLLVSGGHTQVIEVESAERMRTVMRTMDDSFGESFDKVAKMMGMGYPGGPVIEALAQKGDPGRYPFPVPLQKRGELAFSYSGLKNAVRLAIEEADEAAYPDIAASFQHIATEHLFRKLRKYFKSHPPKRFAVVGGASANLYLRKRMQTLLQSYGAALLVAELRYCSDNAAMIGRYAIECYLRGEFTAETELRIHPVSEL